jgi:hypothetical protein
MAYKTSTLPPEVIPTFVQLLKDFWPNDLASFLLNLTPVRRFRPPPSFELFKGSILSELSLMDSRLPKGSLHALLVENFQIITGYLGLWLCALFATENSPTPL